MGLGVKCVSVKVRWLSQWHHKLEIVHQRIVLVVVSPRLIHAQVIVDVFMEFVSALT